MDSGRSFAAPWGKHVKGMTIFALLLLGGLMVAEAFFFSLPHHIDRVIGLVVLALIPLVTALWAVQGYRVEGRVLYIRRLFWETRFELEPLVSVEKDPDALKCSLRKFGNGGLFAFTGRFYNKKLGSFWAYVTDMDRQVVIRLSDRIVVVSPDDPDGFIRAVQARW